MRRLFLSLVLAVSACGPDAEEAIPPEAVEELDEPFTSDVATLMDFELDGQLLSTSGYSLSTQKNQIKAQLMYTIGHLNGEPAGPWLNKVVLTNITSKWEGTLYRIRYHAKLPVAWKNSWWSSLPSSYRFTLPLRVDSTGQSTFTSKYGATCNDGEPQSVTVNNYWYHYRPEASGCSLAPADVMTAAATCRKSDQNTTAKYPEYQKVWEDGHLNVVAIFGKYTEGATSPSDAGIAAWNNFINALRDEMSGATTVPASVPSSPGAALTDITFRLRRSDGTTVNVVALLVDKVTTAPLSFQKRYAEVTPGADVIIYSGHAGLGANVRALAGMGKFFPAKWQLFFMNGCDTFAYSDAATTLATIRSALNPEDASGSRYLDYVSNAMPAYFNDMADASMAVFTALRDYGSPRSYTKMLRDVPGVQIVVATGEEDNVFNSSYDPGVTWNGLDAEGGVARYENKTYQTEVLQPGKYVFALTPDPSAPGGDADLYVRVGTPPTVYSTYKCPSYKYNSNERCAVTLTAPAAVHMLVRGDKDGVTSRYVLSGWQVPR